MEFGTYPTGWLIEGDLPKQVAVSTGSTGIKEKSLLSRYIQRLRECRAEVYTCFNVQVFSPTMADVNCPPKATCYSCLATWHCLCM